MRVRNGRRRGGRLGTASERAPGFGDEGGASGKTARGSEIGRGLLLTGGDAGGEAGRGAQAAGLEGQRKRRIIFRAGPGLYCGTMCPAPCGERRRAGKGGKHGRGRWPACPCRHQGLFQSAPSSPALLPQGPLRFPLSSPSVLGLEPWSGPPGLPSLSSAVT